MKTILITGCSSGFGLATARYFHDREWSVIATMRRPETALLPAGERMRVLALDVSDQASIDAALAEAGPIDVLVNNAGIGWLNAAEATTPEKTRAIFATNTFGTMAMCGAVIPAFRARGNGTIVNVSSSTTLAPMHFLAASSASKAAVNAYTESLALELEPFGVRVRLVIPGRAPDTRFATTGQAAVASAGGFPDAYAGLVQEVFARYAAASQNQVTQADDVTAAIWRAATDPDTPVRLPAGADAVALSGGGPTSSA